MKVLEFKSTRFNSTERKSYFINDGCFGDDVGRWLRERLEARGYEVGEPGQEDWGWYLRVARGDAKHFIAISLVEGANDWRVMFERTRGFRGALRRGPAEPDAQLLAEVDAIMRAEPQITGVRCSDEP